MKPETIILKVNGILIDEFELEPESILSDALLREDLDLDSLDGVDLVVALEKAFGFRVDGKVVAEMKTVGDIHDYIRKNHGVLEQRPLPASAAVQPGV